METMFWIWMAAAVIFLIIELLSPSLFFVSFAVAAGISGVYAQFYPQEYYWQIGIFVIGILITLPLTRRFAKRITKPAPSESNVDALIGKIGLVVSPIDPDTGGKIRYEGETWQAQADEPIEQNAKVRIVEVIGARVRVRRVN